jgi:hypothetical protein
VSQLIQNTRRVARKAHRCDRCHGPINKGEPYLNCVASPAPFGDIGNTTWWRIKECATCAIRYGRGPVVHPPELMPTLKLPASGSVSFAPGTVLEQGLNIVR